MNEFTKIEQSIKTAHMKIKLFDWFRFGKKVDWCPSFERVKEDYLKNNQLPVPCKACYKALIMWARSFSDENMANLFKMLNSFDFDYRGKLNNGVVVFYFRGKDECVKSADLLKQKITEFSVKGFVQWRRACKEFQVLKPELWKNEKDFLPDMSK